MALYRNRYRIEASRLEGWDYGSEASYFITICTKSQEHYFGKIINQRMFPSPLGMIALDEWHKTLKLRSDMNLKLDAFVLMPNHIHGIIIIGANPFNKNQIDVPTTDIHATQRDDTLQGRDAMHRVSTNEGQSKNQFGPQRKNIPSIIRGYKSAVTTWARKNGIEFSWQPRYHDHIIRNQEEYENIKWYIHHNPMKWGEDRFNTAT